MINDMDLYLRAAEKQIQEYECIVAKNGYDNKKRSMEQNKQFGYSTIPDEEWFVFGGQVFVMTHGCPWKEPKVSYRSPYPHNHDFFEMSYVYQGTFCNIVEDQQIDQPQNTLLLLSPQAKHRCHTGSSRDIVFNILIKRELVEKIFLQMFSESESVCRFFLDSLYNVRQKQPFLFFSCGDSLVEIIHSIIEEYFEKRDFYQSIIKAKLIELFSRLSRMYQINQVQAETDPAHYQMFVQIEDYLEQNYSSVTLSSMAAHFNYTPSYLSKLIKRQFNTKFSLLVQDIRLKHACRYLSYSSLPIDQIVGIVGYSDVSHFYRVFKQKYGMAPNQHRKQFNTLNLPPLRK